MGAVLTGVWLLIARKRYRATSVALNLPFGLGNITCEATDQDRVLAWKMYVQLKTRKAALPFDEENDVIIKAEQERGQDFLRLANALSALYPTGTEEKRLLEAMLLAVPKK